MEMIPYIPENENVSGELLAQIEVMFFLADFSIAVIRKDNRIIGNLLADLESDLEIMEMCLELALEHEGWPTVALLIMIIEEWHGITYEVVFTEDGAEIREVVYC